MSFYEHSFGEKGYVASELPDVSYVSCKLKTCSNDTASVEMRYEPDLNCVVLSCPHGRLVIVPETANEVRVYVKTPWEEDKLEV